MKSKKIKTRTIVIAILVIIFTLIVAVFATNYFVGKNNLFSKIANKMLPFPAAIVGSDFISVKIIEDNLVASKRFYENQDFSDQGIRIDFSTEDGKKRLAIKEKNILNRAIENALVKKLLAEKGIEITNDMVSQEVDRKIKEEGSEKEVKSRLLNLYGWNLKKFKERIVRPDIERERLVEKIVAEEDYLNEKLEKIRKAEKKIKDNEKFEDVAKEISEGDSAKAGGDLGWFSAKQMLPEISDIAFKMKKGETSSVIQTQLGFHIVRIDDLKTEDGISMVKVSQIFVRTPTFADWLKKEGQDISVNIMINGYTWNKEEFYLEFEDQEMKKMEEEMLNNFQGDISVIF